MSKIIEKIKADLLTYRKEKNADATRALQTLLGDIGRIDTFDKKSQTTLPVTDKQVLKVISNTMSALKDNIYLYGERGMDSHQAEANFEYTILEAYETAFAPKMMDERELVEIIKAEIARRAQAGEEKPGDIGAIMKYLNGNYADLFDRGAASNILKGL